MAKGGTAASVRIAAERAPLRYEAQLADRVLARATGVAEGDAGDGAALRGGAPIEPLHADVADSTSSGSARLAGRPPGEADARS